MTCEGCLPEEACLVMPHTVLQIEMSVGVTLAELKSIPVSW